MDQDLRNAAEQGNIDALYSSIAMDPKVLDKIDEIPFIETPLHVAAAAGQTQFAMEIMMLKPSFSKKLNPNGFTPLLLAMFNDQTDLLLELLDVHKDLCLAQGRGCMNPLHYAAQMGNLRLLTRFLRVFPKLIEEVTSRSETAMHVALKNDEFDACLLLIGWLRRAWFRNAALWQHRLLNWKDVDGNTLLHIALSKNERQVMRCLLDCKVKVNIENSAGSTPLDIMAKNTQLPSEIRRMLLRAGASSHRPPFPARYLISSIPFNERLFVWFFRQKMEIPIEMRNMLLVVAVLLVTVTYQGVLSPPGGFWQDNTAASSNRNGVSQAPHFAGTVTMAGKLFHLLLAFNSLTFYISLLLIILVIPYGFTSVMLIVSVVLLFLSYGTSVSIIAPLQSYWLWYLVSFCLFLVLNIVWILVASWKDRYVFGTFVEVEEFAWPTFMVGCLQTRRRAID